MSRTARVFERNGHTYQLYEMREDPVWDLFEDFGDEAALVGSITQDGSQFSVECYWKPDPTARLHNIGARTVDEAVAALLDLAAGEDPRGAPTVGSEAMSPQVAVGPINRVGTPLSRAPIPGVEPVEGGGEAEAGVVVAGGLV